METGFQTPISQEPQSRKRRTNAWKLLVLWLLTLALAVLSTVLITRSCVAADSGKLTSALSDAEDVIRSRYYFYDENEDALIASALKGLAAGTGDDYAYYYTADEYREMQKQNEGAFVGIGILTMLEDDGTVRIMEVYPDTPAFEAGMEAGDALIEVNGVSYEGLDLSTFLDNVVSEDGAQNVLKVRRGEKELTFTVIAREVHTPTVSSRMLTDSIGYLRVTAFHGSCVDETKTALKTLLDSGMKSLVLDLRDNLGGSLYDALDIADLFLPKGRLITSLRSKTEEEQTFYTETDGYDLPIVLLVNGYSASASELVSGALKDYEVAYLIGTRTFGKGIVQSYFSIPETDGMLKITTEAYYTPNGVCVHGTGIEPDRTVELSEDAKKYSISVLPFELDTQLQAAIAYLEEQNGQ